MDANRFWQLIDQARGTRDPLAPSLDPAELKVVLTSLPSKDVQEFSLIFDRCLVQLNQWKIWEAGYVLGGGMGDDEFHYFRSWIIGKGKAAFDTALKDVDALASFVSDDDELDNELLEYVPVEVCEARSLPDPREESTEFTDDEPAGEPFDEDTAGQDLPMCFELAQRLGRCE